MTDSRPIPVLWIAALALMVAACGVGLALQLGASRSERVDRARDDATPRSPAPGREDGLPAFGEFVYVEELPEAITKVPPEYPQAAQFAGVTGTVIVQALIGRDGRVKEIKVVQSIPELDDAAASAVAQWTFKPAKNKGEPVAVWVAVPVRFTLD